MATHTAMSGISMRSLCRVLPFPIPGGPFCRAPPFLIACARFYNDHASIARHFNRLCAAQRQKAAGAFPDLGTAMHIQNVTTMQFSSSCSVRSECLWYMHQQSASWEAGRETCQAASPTSLRAQKRLRMPMLICKVLWRFGCQAVVGSRVIAEASAGSMLRFTAPQPNHSNVRLLQTTASSCEDVCLTGHLVVRDQCQQHRLHGVCAVCGLQPHADVAAAANQAPTQKTDEHMHAWFNCLFCGLGLCA